MVRRVIVFSIFCFIALSCKGPVGPPGSDDGFLTDPAIQPRVIYSFPGNGSKGPYENYNNTVLVRFNKLMNRESIKRAVHLDSPFGDARIDTSRMTSDNTDVFNFSVTDTSSPTSQLRRRFQFRIGVVYTLRLDSTATDINGNFLAPSFAMVFTPEPYFRVTGIAPSNGATAVSTSSQITLQFNSKVDSSIFSSIHVSPLLNGHWAFSPAFPSPDSTIIHFSFQNAPDDTMYTVIIDQGAHDILGNVMPQQFASSFETAAFAVTGTNPSNGSTNVSLNTNIIFNFNQTIDTGSVRTAFTITPNVEGNIVLFKGPSSFLFVPKTHFASNTIYNVTVSGMMRSKSGAPLLQPYTFSFSTVPFEVSRTNPQDGGFNVPMTVIIDVSLTDLIDTGTVRSAFAISPPVEGSLRLFDGSSSFSFVPKYRLLASTVYTVTLSTMLQSKTAVHLAQPDSFSFSTAQFMVSNSYPYDGATNVFPTNNISFSCTDLIDTGTVRSAFMISPAVEGSLQLFDGSSSFSFVPSHRLLTSTTYTVTLSTALQSKTGAHLPLQYTASFSTVPFIVSYSNLYDGTTNVPLNITVTFNCTDLIDTSTIRSALSISPSLPLTINLRDSASYFTVVPSVDFMPNTIYSLTVSTALKSRSGQVLAAPYNVSFTTGSFSVTGSTPPNGATIDPQYSPNINISFNSTIDTGSVRAAFAISPAVSGSFQLFDGRSYFSFVPDVQLAPGTVYNVSISTALRSKSGGNLSAPYVFSFSTVPFNVRYTQPNDGAINQPLTSAINITFNSPIDTTGIFSAITVAPPISTSISTYEGSRTVWIYPLEPMELNTSYTVSVGAAFRSQGGAVLGTPYNFSFTTVPFKVASTIPINGSINVSRSTQIEFDFSAPIDTGSVRSAFHISPNVPGILNLYYETSTVIFTPFSPLSANTEYTFTLDAGVTSKNGVPLAAQYNLSFATGN